MTTVVKYYPRPWELSVCWEGTFTLSVALSSKTSKLGNHPATEEIFREKCAWTSVFNFSLPEFRFISNIFMKYILQSAPFALLGEARPIRSLQHGPIPSWSVRQIQAHLTPSVRTLSLASSVLGRGLGCRWVCSGGLKIWMEILSWSVYDGKGDSPHITHEGRRGTLEFMPTDFTQHPFSQAQR